MLVMVGKTIIGNDSTQLVMVINGYGAKSNQQMAIVITVVIDYKTIISNGNKYKLC